MKLERGNLVITPLSGSRTSPDFRLWREMTDAPVIHLSADDLRWLCFIAGPAMIHAHTPVSAEVESQQRTPLPPWDPPPIHPGQLEIE